MEEYEVNSGDIDQEEIELDEDEVELENLDDLGEIRLAGEKDNEADYGDDRARPNSTRSEEPPDIKDYAAKVYAMEIVSGEFVRGSGSRSYLRMWNGEDVDKVRILGTLVQSFTSNDGNYCAQTIDDGTETIRIKGWREEAQSMASFQVGQIVDVIGSVREYDGEVYLSPIAINVIDDPNWEPLRELEIFKLRRVKKDDLQL